MFIDVAYAQTAPTGVQAILASPITMIVLLFVIFYFLLIRPQQKRLKDHQNMVGGIRRGDVVVTAGGLIGKVAKVADDDVEIDLAEGVRVKAVKSTISDVRTKTEPADDKKSEKK
ncbi:MAG: preprotein translocase subunit YajC [Sphingomonadales bacterium]